MCCIPCTIFLEKMESNEKKKNWNNPSNKITNFKNQLFYEIETERAEFNLKILNILL